MERKKRLLFFVLFFCVVFFVSQRVSFGATINQTPMRYENSSDFMCGFAEKNDDLVTSNNMLIKFYNPHDFPVMLNSIVSLTEQFGLNKPEFKDRYLNVIISPKRDFQIDCGYIYDLFFKDSLESAVISEQSFNGNFYAKNVSHLDVFMEHSTDSRLMSLMVDTQID